MNNSPQVSYHQGQGPNTPQRGAPQRPGGPNAAYASHFSNPVPYSGQPGYNSVQNKVICGQELIANIFNRPTPTAPATASQQQVQQVLQPPPQVAASAPPQQQQPQVVSAAPPPPPPPQKPAAESKMELDVETNGAQATPAAGPVTKPTWMKKGVKVNKVVKRRRQNARLRRLLVPKNALMAINEICPGPKFTVQEHTNAVNQVIYSVRLEIDGKVHSGQSINKTHAKQMACENALKDILVTRMQAQTLAPAGDLVKEEESASVAGDKDETMSTDGSTRGGSDPRHLEDDMPWGCLASFALHKLFSEWQNQGVEIPFNKPMMSLRMRRPGPPPMGGPPVPPGPSPNQSGGALQANIHPMKKIPDDAHKKHPVLMLNQLIPGLQYQERMDGHLPNATFVFSLSIEGQLFTGSGTTKKEAKKECAKAALVKFGIHSEY
ncbi:double-stranded RNA-specific editase 1 isoform X2 [Nilaparvata lugens]|nr:double-stranded RNA-specific editase 1 isoform X2 [Nilaparvata lugens]